MEALAAMPRYEAYKDSGVEKIGLIPSHWNVKKLKFESNINKHSLPENTTKNFRFFYVDIGGVSLEKGIEEMHSLTFKEAPSRARRLAQSGDIVVSTVRTYLKAIASVNKESENFVYSTGFAVVSPRDKSTYKFLANFIKSDAFTGQVDLVAKGMSYPAINSTELSNLFVLSVPEEERVEIARFLDQKTAQIDEAISIKEKQIELLKEHKQIIIQKAVTQGLDPNVPLKDSGVDWIGEIPEHWRIESFKHILVERNKKNHPIKSRERLSLSIDKGVTLYSEKTTNLDRFKDDFKQYKLAYQGDLVFNSMNMIVGAVGVSEYFGCVSPVYYTYHSKQENSRVTKYYEYYFRSRLVQSQLYCLGKGIMAIDRGDGKFNTVRLKVSRDDLRSMKVPYPTISEIEKIVRHIELQNLRINKAIKLQEHQIAKLKEYKAILINSAVTGKIKVPSSFC